jgi:hypothetical protein
MVNRTLISQICGFCGVKFDNCRVQECCSRGCANKLKAQRDSAKQDAQPRTLAFACGGGVDSTAIAALICQGKIPKPSLAWIVDCGWEKSRTWAYVNAVLIPKLAQVGVTLAVIESDNNDIILPNGHIAIPAYEVLPDGTTTKYKTHCNESWKRRIGMQYLKSNGLDWVEVMVGIAADEARRVRPDKAAWYHNSYPLIDLHLSRADCLYMIGSIGWPQPPKTSCFICPQQNDADWADVKHNWRDDWARALQLERDIHQVKPMCWLHRSCKPLDEAVR